MSASPYRTTIIIRSRRILTFLLLAVALAPPARAQRTSRQNEEARPEPNPTYSSKKEEPGGPRAIAVLEWTAKGPRLIPVAIKIDKDFYDASLYLAQPVPMAIDSGVVYEVQKAGEPLGDFTLSEAEQTGNGLWVGLGNFDSKAAQDKRKEAAAKRAAAATAAKAAEEKEEEGDRPVLKRATPRSGTPAETPSSSAPTPASTPQPTSASSAPPLPPPPSSSPQLSETDSDPNRPILRRGKPAPQPTSAPDYENAPSKAATSAPQPAATTRLEVAVSDASPKEGHPYTWTWKDSDEEQKLKAQAVKLVQTILADYASKTNGPKPGELKDIDFQTYDLTYSNAATVVLSARVLPASAVKPTTIRHGAKATKAPAPVADTTPGFEYYITVVGREDIYGQMQKELAVATDSKHLDAFPKMKLVDIVDADGNGAGDLLFQSTSDRGDSFVIYRDLGWSLQELIKVPEPKV